jgi:hypothetical protein
MRAGQAMTHGEAEAKVRENLVRRPQRSKRDAVGNEKNGTPV